jgi:hypothetical protein
MAAAPDVSGRIAANLRELHSVADDLPRIADGWDRTDENSQVTFYMG